ncbi:hypothetical protein B296_00055300 [Ensete ventricosum]|uniref:Uncharacterized protein n=1 Tax=Ensete ventricosum TaxID=4639 RepID=A0A426XF84_ENSVE|nr:hypothetical protein B296_00055300 [Ensete ventricosum]
MAVETGHSDAEAAPRRTTLHRDRKRHACRHARDNEAGISYLRFVLLWSASPSSRPLAADPIALDHLGRGFDVMCSSCAFAVSIDTVHTGRYIPVRQQTGTRTARYRAVLPTGAVSAPLLPEISR